MASVTAPRSRPAETGGAASFCEGGCSTLNAAAVATRLWPTFLKETELYARGFAEKGYTKLTVEVQLGVTCAVVQFQCGR